MLCLPSVRHFKFIEEFHGTFWKQLRVRVEGMVLASDSLPSYTGRSTLPKDTGGSTSHYFAKGHFAFSLCKIEIITVIPIVVFSLLVLQQTGKDFLLFRKPMVGLLHCSGPVDLYVCIYIMQMHVAEQIHSLLPILEAGVKSLGSYNPLKGMPSVT